MQLRAQVLKGSSNVTTPIRKHWRAGVAGQLWGMTFAPGQLSREKRPCVLQERGLIFEAMYQEPWVTCPRTLPYLVAEGAGPAMATAQLLAGAPRALHGL